MNLTYLQKNGAPQLLLIYAGWSTDPEAFEKIVCPGYDIAVAWDYSSLQPVADADGYDEVVVIAWSLGVLAAELTAGSLPLTLTVAVNGTPEPADDEKGIPLLIFRRTAEELTERSLAKFRLRMGAPDMARGARSIASLRDELLGFIGRRSDGRFRWDRAVISRCDRIFPPANQEAAWQDKAEITMIDGPHTPDFQSIVDAFVINKSLVGARFAKGRDSYDGEADVQHRIADRLFSLWQKHGVTPYGHILEIGVGNGYFTSLYAPKTRAAITLWDIAPTSAENVVRADAEQSLPRVADASLDAIASASTMQWFNSAAAFLRQCARTLRSGGLAVLSTFGPDTFRQLTEAGAVPLPYLSVASLRRIMPPELEILEMLDGKIQKVFYSPVDVIRHLKATGVNARPARRPLRQILDDYPRRPDGRCGLTYQPIYMILKRK